MIEARFDIPFEEQMAFFRQKGYTLSPNTWRDVWQQAHARAFTVARVTKMDVLADIRGAVDRAMEEGATLREFKKGIKGILERKGWLAPKGEKAQVKLPDGTVRKRLTGWRLDTIYRANLGTSYQVGRYKQMTDPDVLKARPFWQYMTAGDPAVRDDHDAQNGKVYSAEHPFWDTWYPPNGFRCRCYVKTLSERQMESRGLKEQKHGVEEKPDEGWRYNPGKAGLDTWKPELAGYDAKAREIVQKAIKKPPVAKTQAQARKLMDEYGKNISALEREAVLDYGKGMSGVWNPALWKGGPLPNNIQEPVDALSRFIRGAPKYQGTVYRSVGADVPGMNNLRSGDLVRLNGFTSTAVDRKIGEGFARDVLGDEAYKVMAIKSKRGVFLGELSPMSHEAEVLFDRGSFFVVKKVDKKGKINLYFEEVVSASVKDPVIEMMERRRAWWRFANDQL